MDFQSLTRRELQTLCKKNKIPANMTNVAMADALKALQNVIFSLNPSNPIFYFWWFCFGCWFLLPRNLFGCLEKKREILDFMVFVVIFSLNPSNPIFWFLVILLEPWFFFPRTVWRLGKWSKEKKKKFSVLYFAVVFSVIALNPSKPLFQLLATIVWI